MLGFLATACATPPAAAPPRLHHHHRGSTPFAWNRVQLLAASPVVGTHFEHVLGKPRAARTTQLSLRIGALFVHATNGNHYCTASVVDSPGQDLLITAAHCLNTGGRGAVYRSDVVFVPGYRDGEAPYGIWTPAKLIVAQQWLTDANPDYDVGFVVLKPYKGKNIEQVLGANRLALDTSYRYLVRVTGYPESADAPITCRNWTTKQSATQLRFDCPGYTNGTSGSPWVANFDPKTRTGTIVGVIGGYQEGGDSPQVSYSARFGSGIESLYRVAVTAERASS